MTLRFTLLLCTVSLALGCSGPVAWMSGGPLSGPTASPPASWAYTDEIDTVQLETLPAEPYSVNIWVTAIDPYLYVHAGPKRTNWVEHLEREPRARMRIGGTNYEVLAERVTEQEEFDRFSEAYGVKYGWKPRNENVQEAYLFRMTAR